MILYRQLSTELCTDLSTGYPVYRIWHFRDSGKGNLFTLATNEFQLIDGINQLTDPATPIRLISASLLLPEGKQQVQLFGYVYYIYVYREYIILVF